MSAKAVLKGRGGTRRDTKVGSVCLGCFRRWACGFGHKLSRFVVGTYVHAVRTAEMQAAESEGRPNVTNAIEKRDHQCTVEYLRGVYVSCR